MNTGIIGGICNNTKIVKYCGRSMSNADDEHFVCSQCTMGITEVKEAKYVNVY